MKPLSRKEIDDLINIEGGNAETYKDYTIPYEARSKFTFEIKENIKDIVDEIIKKHKLKYAPEIRHIDDKTGEVFFTGGRPHNTKEENPTQRNDANTGNSYRSLDNDFRTYTYSLGWRWDEVHGSNGEYQLWDTNFDCYASVSVKENKINIETAWSGFKYEISQNQQGGCTVEFSGPLNGLKNQTLLPNMTYKKGTLRGKFVDNEGDITPYLNIEDYCILRDEKNRGRENNQDEFGRHINAMFNNEIPSFPQWSTQQELKNRKAQNDFEKEQRVENSALERTKELLRKRARKDAMLEPEIKSGIAKTEESGYKHISRTPKEGVKTPAWMRKLNHDRTGE